MQNKAHFSQEGNTRILTLDPVDIVFQDLTVKLQTKMYFEEGSSNIKIERTILEMSDPAAEVEINEYMVACYGTTEYSEDMTNVKLSITDGRETKKIDYAYKCREEQIEGATETVAVIPEIETRVSISCGKKDAVGYIREGYAFSPMFTLGYTTSLRIRRYLRHGSIWQRQIKLQMSLLLYERPGY